MEPSKNESEYDSEEKVPQFHPRDFETFEERIRMLDAYESIPELTRHEKDKYVHENLDASDRSIANETTEQSLSKIRYRPKMNKCPRKSSHHLINSVVSVNKSKNIKMRDQLGIVHLLCASPTMS